MSSRRSAQKHGYARRLNSIFVAVTFAILVPISSAPVMGAVVAFAASNPSKPNLFDPTSQARSIKHAPPSKPTPSPAIAPGAGSAAMPCKVGSLSMHPARVPIGSGVSSHFVSDDGRLSVDSPSGAVSGAQIAADGGATSLLVRQILGPSGSNAGGSGHYSFGTYLIQVVGASGHLASHGLQTPIALTLHYGDGDSAMDVGHAYAVINGSVPPCVNLDPTAVVVPGEASSPGGAPTPNGTSASTSPQTSLGSPTSTPATQNAPSNLSSPALLATVGSLATPSTSFDSNSRTLTTTATVTSATTTASWGTDSPVATFGKPDPVEVDLGGGSLTTSYNIDVPAGPKGFKPPLSLVYNSAGVSDQHNAQGAAPWVGEGWNMTMGSISWAEHNVNPTGTAIWQDSWELSDAFGTAATLVPPATNTTIYREDSQRAITPSPIQWHTAPETYAKVFSFLSQITLPGTTVRPPCWRVFLPNGIMEEFGCTKDSLQYYPEPSGVNAGKAYVSSWLLDLITEPDGNQIHVTYWQDMETASGMLYPRDAALQAVQWDSPTCSDPNTACSSTGTAPTLWKPRMQVFFSAGPNVNSGVGTSCTARNYYTRCDTPVDLSASGGIAAPIVQSEFVLNYIEVDVSDSSSAQYPWHLVRIYWLAYDQTTPTTITDPMSGKQESTAGRLTLKQIQVSGDDLNTSLPLTNFTYTKKVEFYEDSLFAPVPATNCGPSWNKGDTRYANPKCRLWSESYNGNSYYLSAINNGLGLNQTFTWVNNRDNMHGVNVGRDPSDPLYCTVNQDAGGGASFPCDMADDETWSRVSLGSQTNALIRLSQAGQGGAQTSTPVTGTTSYKYKDVYPLTAQECQTCVAGYSWGNQVDNDFLDFYNGKFMGFKQVDVSNPDGSAETHKYYSTAGWGVWDYTKVTAVPCPAPPDVCHNDPWWGLNNAAHGHEIEFDRYATDGTTLLQQVLTQYAAICRPPWLGGGSPPVTGYGNWNSNLVSPLDLGNPVAVCDIQTTRVDNKTFDGSASTAVPDKTTTYTYETGPSGCVTCYGRVIKQTITSNDGTANGSPTAVVMGTSYIWNDLITKNSDIANGPYLINFSAFSDIEDSVGARYKCTYNGYDQIASGATGPNTGLTHGDLTQQDRYTSCGTTPSFTPTGPITGTFGFDSSGNPLWSNDADLNAGNTTHGGCTAGGTQHSNCATFDGFFAALSTKQANALNQTSTTTFQDPLSTTAPPNASGGFGVWPMSAADANNQTTTYTYDPLGRETTVALPGETAGTTQTLSYTAWCSTTAAGSPCAEIDRTQRLTNTTTITYRGFYDGMGHLAETRSPAPNGQDIVQYYYYDFTQRQVFKSIPYFVAAYSGSPGSAAYSIPDSTVAGTKYAYDGVGRTTSITDPLSGVTTSGYSVVCSAVGTGDTACYEQVMTIDPLGHESGVLTDALDRVNYEQRFTGNSVATYALYAMTKYAYDYSGDLTKILHPDAVTTTTFQYDMAGRQVGLIDPDRGVETYTYDQNGNLINSVDARGTDGTVYTGFDGIDRPIWHNSINSPTGAYNTYSYDSTANGSSGVGRLTGEGFSGAPNNALSGNSSFVYDVRGQQTQSTLTVGTTSYPLQTSYDDAGSLLTQIYPDGETVTNTRGAQDWLSGVSTSLGGPTLLSAALYTGSGGANGSMTAANLAATAYQFSATFDLVGRPMDLKTTRSSDQATLFDQTRTFDAAGNVGTANTTLSTGIDHQAFCYDEQNRLTAAASSGTLSCATLSPGTLTSAFYNQSFAYDNMGRLTSGPLGTYAYGNGAHLHAATAIGGAYTAAYDSSGDMTCRAPSALTTCSGTQTAAQLTYNSGGQLSNWQNQPGSATSTAAFLYDGQGNRVAQQTSSGGSPTTTVYIGNIEEDATTGGITTRTVYYYANGQRFAMAVNGAVRYLASDGLGSANVTLDANGNVIASMLYAPYGTARYSTGTMPTNRGFTGQLADPTSGLDYYGARYYDPLAGQFTSADTVLPGNGFDLWGLSRFAYVEGNPEVRTDPTGRYKSCGPGGCHEIGGTTPSGGTVSGSGAPPPTSNQGAPPSSKPPGAPSCDWLCHLSNAKDALSQLGNVHPTENNCNWQQGGQGSSGGWCTAAAAVLVVDAIVLCVIACEAAGAAVAAGLDAAGAAVIGAGLAPYVPAVAAAGGAAAELGALVLFKGDGGRYIAPGGRQPFTGYGGIGDSGESSNSSPPSWGAKGGRAAAVIALIGLLVAGGEAIREGFISGGQANPRPTPSPGPSPCQFQSAPVPC